jgi:hypothetical protein
MSNKIYPIGIQNFEKLRTGGYFYIDKTELIYRIIKTGSYYFLSRPRRFGKSLLISTIEAYFQGKKELFEGLAMEKLEKDWIEHPILHMDLNIEKYDCQESLDNMLEKTLAAVGKACMEPIHPNVLFPSVSLESSNEPTNRQANAS